MADSAESYTKNFNWTETDIVIGAGLDGHDIAADVHVLVVEPTSWHWGVYGGGSRSSLEMDGGNTEREVTVPSECHALYKPLADELASHLRRSNTPPLTFRFWAKGEYSVLVQTTSDNPVAVRFLHKGSWENQQGENTDFVVVAIPMVDNLSEWFHAFLTDINALDKPRVPYPPPRLSMPWDWYTPKEKELVRQLGDLDERIKRLEGERSSLDSQLKAEAQNADNEARRVLWADGGDLVDAIKAILTQFGFNVEDMDALIGPKDARREDLRLTLDDLPGWEAIVEVKGYKKGTKAGDARQVRQFRDDYTTEKGRLPDLTLWIANPFRLRDPSVRPSPSRGVTTACENIGSVYVSTLDLYRLWVLVVEGSLKPSKAARRLINAGTGLGNLGV